MARQVSDASSIDRVLKNDCGGVLFGKPEKEMIMRTVWVISIILATLSLSSDAALAATWCAHYGRGGTNCGFHSYGQCQAAISGNGGFCSQGN